jgi:cytochrome P450
MSAIQRFNSHVGWNAFNAWWRQGHILAALQSLHDDLGDVFRLPLPGFDAIFMVGAEANKFLLLESRNDLRWRAECDPVTRLLRHGILVEDGISHDNLRQLISPSLHHDLLDCYTQVMWRRTDQVTEHWQHGMQIDPVAEMRRITLLILTDTLFEDDFSPYMKPLWQAIHRTIQFISPGPWLIWPGIPRPGYQKALHQMDEYSYRLIERRRAHLGESTDMLGLLIASGMSDALIRDQLLTMFIAGHDTSTALLAWSLLLLATHQDSLAQAQAEVDRGLSGQEPTLTNIKQLGYLDSVIKETLRLYPPIHLGSRIAATDLTFRGHQIPTGSRVLYSTYLTHRNKDTWPDPERFDPDRFSPGSARRHSPYAYIPFGGGPRNCIGAAFAQVEAKVVLARILQGFRLRLARGTLRPRMHATLEPHSGTRIEIQRRTK